MRDSLLTHNEMTSVSNKTVSVPAAAPNSRTEAKTNVSDTEILEGMDGTLIVNEPVRSVRAARANHSGGIGFQNRTAIE